MNVSRKKVSSPSWVESTFSVYGVLSAVCLLIALYQGATRTRNVEIYVDDALVATWTSSGTTDGFESIYLAGVAGKVIKITGVLENSEWLSIMEVVTAISATHFNRPQWQLLPEKLRGYHLLKICSWVTFWCWC